ERGEDRERAAAEERGEQRERERGADEQPGELDRPQRQVGALEQELEVSPLPAVPEGVLGRAEEAVEDLEPLPPRPLLQRAPAGLNVRGEPLLEPGAAERRGDEHPGGEDEQARKGGQQQVAELAVDRAREQPRRLRRGDASRSGDRDGGGVGAELAGRRLQLEPVTGTARRQ